jgi:benzoyl-CoA 2,3-dioxygenase component A
MEEGVDGAFREVRARNALDWDELLPRLREGGRYHVETY